MVAPPAAESRRPAGRNLPGLHIAIGRMNSFNKYAKLIAMRRGALT
jgi:hypothetical protein